MNDNARQIENAAGFVGNDDVTFNTVTAYRIIGNVFKCHPAETDILDFAHQAVIVVDPCENALSSQKTRIFPWQNTSRKH
jgi:hypothetical protein